MNQIRASNRLKAIKKTISGLIGSFNIKKIRNLFKSSFLKILSFFAFLSHLETSHFSYRGFVNQKPFLQSNEAQRKKIDFKEMLMFFFLNSTLGFS